MSVLKHWKAILVILLVFAAGLVSGIVATHMAFKHAFQKGLSVETWNAEAMKFMRREIQITPEQEPKIRAIIEENGRQFQRSFGHAVRESGTNLVASWHQIDQELTPEQQEVFRQKRQEFRAGIKKTFKIDLPPD